MVKSLYYCTVLLHEMLNITDNPLNIQRPMEYFSGIYFKDMPVASIVLLVLAILNTVYSIMLQCFEASIKFNCLLEM